MTPEDLPDKIDPGRGDGGDVASHANGIEAQLLYRAQLLSRRAN